MAFENTPDLPLLLFGKLNACLATPAVGDHEPKTHGHRSTAIWTRTHEDVAVQPELFG